MQHKSQLRLLKLLYLLNGFSAASFGRFATLFYLSRSLSETQIGYIEALNPIANALGNLIFGIVADRLQRKKAVGIVARLLATALTLNLLIPAVGCQRCFHQILTNMAVMSFFAVGGGVLDAYTLDLLGDSRRGEYGKYRLWTAVSWGLGNAAMGWVADVDFDLIFIPFGVLNLIAAVLMGALLPRQTKDEARIASRRKAAAPSLAAAGAAAPLNAVAISSDEAAPAEADAPGKELTLAQAMCRARQLFFFGEMVVIGFGMCVVEKFLFIYVRRQLGGSYTLCGYAVAVTVLIELPIFAKGDVLIRRLGHDAMVLFALLAYAVRTFGYTLLTADSVHYGLLALEVLHGITFGFGWTAAVDFAKASSPARWITTSQLLLNTCMNSIGVTSGALFGGYFMRVHGGASMYRVAAMGASALFVLHALTAIVLRICGARGFLVVEGPRALPKSAVSSAGAGALLLDTP